MKIGFDEMTRIIVFHHSCQQRFDVDYITDTGKCLSMYRKTGDDDAGNYQEDLLMGRFCGDYGWSR